MTLDPYLLPVVPLAYRDDYIEVKPCKDEHMWVRSNIISGRREVGKNNAPIYIRVEEPVVWCEFCGSSYMWPRKKLTQALGGGEYDKPTPQEFRVRSAHEYYEIMNPNRTPYTGIDTGFYDGWVQGDHTLRQTHTDWEHQAFRREHGHG